MSKACLQSRHKLAKNLTQAESLKINPAKDKSIPGKALGIDVKRCLPKTDIEQMDFG
jgi:hypothetical protein